MIMSPPFLLPLPSKIYKFQLVDMRQVICPDVTCELYSEYVSFSKEQCESCIFVSLQKQLFVGFLEKFCFEIFYFFQDILMTGAFFVKF